MKFNLTINNADGTQALIDGLNSSDVYCAKWERNICVNQIEITKQLYKANKVEVDLQIAKEGSALSTQTLKEDLLNARLSVWTETSSQERINVAQNYLIHEVQPDFGDVLTVKLIAYSPDQLLTYDKFCSTWVAKRLGNELVPQVLSSVFSDTGLESQFDASHLQHLVYNNSQELIQPYLVQYNESFYDMLRRTAYRCGEYLFYEDEKLYLGLDTTVDPVVDIKCKNTHNNFQFRSQTAIAPAHRNYLNSGDAKTASVLSYHETASAEDYMEERVQSDVSSGDVWGEIDTHMAGYLSTALQKSSLADMTGYVASTVATELFNSNHSADSLNKTYNKNWHFDDEGKDTRAKQKEQFTTRDSHLAYRPYATALSSTNLDAGFIENNQKNSRTAEATLTTITMDKTDYQHVKLGGIIQLQGQTDMQVVTHYHWKEAKEGVEDYTVEAVSYQKDAVYPPFQKDIALTQHSDPQVAFVTAIGDPMNIGRVCIKYPWQQKSESDSPWIRRSSQMASKQSGLFFELLKDDEVLIDYVGGNIEAPYVVGSLYNKANTTPAVAHTSNSDVLSLLQSKCTRAITSPNGHTIFFNDPKEQKTGWMFADEFAPVLSFIKGIVTTTKEKNEEDAQKAAYKDMLEAGNTSDEGLTAKSSLDESQIMYLKNKLSLLQDFYSEADLKPVNKVSDLFTDDGYKDEQFEFQLEKLGKSSSDVEMYEGKHKSNSDKNKLDRLKRTINNYDLKQFIDQKDKADSKNADKDFEELTNDTTDYDIEEYKTIVATASETKPYLQRQALKNAQNNATADTIESLRSFYKEASERTLSWENLNSILGFGKTTQDKDKQFDQELQKFGKTSENIKLYDTDHSGNSGSSKLDRLKVSIDNYDLLAFITKADKKEANQSKDFETLLNDSELTGKVSYNIEDYKSINDKEGKSRAELQREKLKAVKQIATATSIELLRSFYQSAMNITIDQTEDIRKNAKFYIHLQEIQQSYKDLSDSDWNNDKTASTKKEPKRFSVLPDTGFSGGDDFKKLEMVGTENQEKATGTDRFIPNKLSSFQGTNEMDKLKDRIEKLKLILKDKKVAEKSSEAKNEKYKNYLEAKEAIEKREADEKAALKNHYKGGITLADSMGIYQISMDAGKRNISIKSPVGDVKINAFTGITISAPTGDISIKGKNITLEAGNNVKIISGKNNNTQKAKSWISAGASVLSGAGGAMLSTVVSDTFSENLDTDYISGYVDLAAVRTVLECLVKPVEGTLQIHSGNNLLLESGGNNATLPKSMLSSKTSFSSTDKLTVLYGVALYARDIKKNYEKAVKDLIQTPEQITLLLQKPWQAAVPAGPGGGAAAPAVLCADKHFLGADTAEALLRKVMADTPPKAKEAHTYKETDVYPDYDKKDARNNYAANRDQRILVREATGLLNNLSQRIFAFHKFAAEQKKILDYLQENEWYTSSFFKNVKDKLKEYIDGIGTLTLDVDTTNANSPFLKLTSTIAFNGAGAAAKMNALLLAIANTMVKDDKGSLLGDAGSKMNKVGKVFDAVFGVGEGPLAVYSNPDLPTDGIRETAMTGYAEWEKYISNFNAPESDDVKDALISAGQQLATAVVDSTLGGLATAISTIHGDITGMYNDVVSRKGNKTGKILIGGGKKGTLVLKNDGSFTTEVATSLDSLKKLLLEAYQAPAAGAAGAAGARPWGELIPEKVGPLSI